MSISKRIIPARLLFALIGIYSQRKMDQQIINSFYMFMFAFNYTKGLIAQNDKLISEQENSIICVILCSISF